MSFDRERMLRSKREFRRDLAKRPISEKLHLMEAMAERALAVREDTSVIVPDEPWAIPSHWRWARMGDVSTVVGGGTPRTDRTEYFGGDVPWITPADLSKYTEKTISKGARNISRVGLENSGARLLPAGTVLFSSRAPIGYVAIAANPVATNQGFKSFILGDELLPDFVYYYLQRARELAVSLASGTTFLEISGKNAARLPIPVPPIDDQRQIVAEIEKQFTRLEAGVTALKRVQAGLKRYRAAVLKAACQGKLVPTEAELARKEMRNYETASDRIGRTEAPPRPNRWKSRCKDVIPGHAALAVGNPDTRLPEGWAWAGLADIARMESGHTPSREHPEWWDGDVAWIGIADARKYDGRVIHDTIQHTNDGGLANSAARLLPEGTVCISRTASVGYVVVMGKAMATSQDFVNWAPTSAVTSDWLRVVFSADREALRRFGKGSVHKTIYFPEWLSIHVAVPPLAEQKRIVAELERRLSVVDGLEAAVSASLQRAARLRQAILQRAFVGEAL